MKASIVRKPGGPEVIELVERPDPVPGPGEVLVEVAFAGVNFMDIGVRQGRFWDNFSYPKPLGVEGSGKVALLGEDVGDFKIGQRVAWVSAPGSYADKVLMPASSLVHIPDEIDDRTAASLMMQGLTASHFATEFYAVQPGDVALVHAAAGGLGQLLTQLVNLRGGKVIGRVSSQEKIAAAKAAGAAEVIVDTEGRFAERVLALTGGEGVHVVYDGSGPSTFQGSLDSLRHSGTFAWYGPVLGGPGAIDVMSLPKSIKLGYAVYAHHVRTPELLRQRAAQLFEWVRAGDLRVHIGSEFPLEAASLAHASMESRSTVGKLLLKP